MQLDLSQFRLSWDTTTAHCSTVEAESAQHAESNTAEAMVYHWEVQYPTFFSNRCSSCSTVSSALIYLLRVDFRQVFSLLELNLFFESLIPL